VDDAAIEGAVRQAAASTGIAHEVVPCDPELADTEAFCAAYGYAMEDSANCVVVIGKADPPVYAACVVLATTRLDVNGAVRRRLGTRKASFAPADDVVAATGMAIGGVTPLALPAGLPLWVDSAVMDRDRIVLGAGSRNAKVLAPPAILEALGAEVVPGLARPAEPGG
jgi:prolyl-tRNA editing enzyme YbaK/EbsC (Cys-tRNA(Pro) deacylase)